MTAAPGPCARGTLCHWLSVRLMQLPHHRELMRLSFRALGRLAAKLRVAMPTTAHKRRFVADLLASASQACDSDGSGPALANRAILARLALRKLLVPSSPPTATSHKSEHPKLR